MVRTSKNSPRVTTLRVATRCTNVDEFVRAYAKFCDDTSLFIASKQTLQLGVAVPFSIELADGTPALRGDGIVLDAWTATSNQNRFKRPGMRLTIQRLDSESVEVFNMLRATRAAFEKAAPTRREPRARSSTLVEVVIPPPAPPHVRPLQPQPPPQARTPEFASEIPQNRPRTRPWAVIVPSTIAVIATVCAVSAVATRPKRSPDATTGSGSGSDTAPPPAAFIATPTPTPSLPPPPHDAELDKKLAVLLDRDMAKYQAIYENLHRHPELSGEEVETAKVIATELESYGFKVTTNIGGHGVVGMLENGPGPTVMVRTDMDALPVEELTDLPYTSLVPGQSHACGHDMHIANWLEAGHLLSELHDRWQGTLLMVGQPSEEVLTGAQALIDDGLYSRFPKPDYGLAEHIIGRGKKGQLYYHAGYTFAASDSFEAIQYGAGTHAANPHFGIDPADMFAQFKFAVNEIIAREIDPVEPAVVTIGKVEIGTKDNIVADVAKTAGIIRYFNPAVGDRIKARMQEVLEAISVGVSARTPELTFDRHTASLYNDPVLTDRVAQILRSTFGEDHVEEISQTAAAEDFAEYSARGKFPTVFFFVGTSDSLPTTVVNHSPHYAPPFDPTWKLAATAFVEIVVTQQPRKK